MKKEKKDSRSLREKLEQDFDVPSDILCGGSMLEVRGKGNATVIGCRKILEYTPNVISLRMAKNILTITGERLVCLTYYAGQIAVRGEIQKIEFWEEENWHCSNP